ncbi:gametogenetin-binding protein 1 [Rattus norvegicus]|uniref:Gametogenetin-binding protein 1 n=2 Tax=Rattus norvegicus TaxID=10116 RepID=GGNB1_RAT|nr:gametogenetin-binding protein 1 [Rattus norvegicus]Q5J2D6.1 RecName: Full=Gametogenetin-binding protein 1 [Rattus norvegicus]AAI05839.1 Gametogenetin-binding protein 1 [Rattus norvegicus]AAS93935.1 gametogenetin-binding protein 1 [Rattus norvegicus]EDL96873.1 gametogenetin-binding protein 1 [Rattus norvegicus]|eukprot:NP_001009972.1 gametogenetin-binding protein 1 [Rattus norvegicus]
MAAQARTPRSRILGCSSMLRFLRSLVGSKGSSKSSNRPLNRSQPSSSPEQDVVSPTMGHQGGCGRKETRPRVLSATSSNGKREPRPRVLSAAPSNQRLRDASGLGTGDTGSQTLTSKDVLKLRAQGVEVTSVPTRGTWEVLEHLPEKKGEEGEPAGEVSGASDRAHFGQALEAEQGCLQWVSGPMVLPPEAFIKEEEDEHCLIDFGDLRLSSCKVGSTPWNYLLGLYKQLQKSAMTKAQRPDADAPQFALKDSSPTEERGEREEAVDESSLKWCAPRASSDDSNLKWCAPRNSTYQSPLQKTFRSTDTVGFVESELKKILAVQREARLWKVGNPEGRELLTQPDITLEEAGMVDGQHLLLEEMDEMGNWPPPE